MKSQARPWDESDTKRYEDSLKKIGEVKEWRKKEAAAGRPADFDDYCRAHGLCSTCHATGLTWDPETQGFKIVGADGDTQLFEQCLVCGGTGKLPAL